MHKAAAVVGGVLGGAALLGVGMAVGSQVGQEQALIAAANVDGPLTAQDKLLLGSFTQASGNFDELVARARKGKQVGPEMTKQAVSVLNIKRLAASEPLRNAAEASAEAMLLLGAGITANDEGTVQEGVTAYKEAQEVLVDFAREINPDTELPAPDGGDGSDEGQQSPPSE